MANVDCKLVTRDKKTFLVIEAEIPPVKSLPKSGSGKNLLVATTSGNMKTDLKYDGKTITVGLNAYIPAEG